MPATDKTLTLLQRLIAARETVGGNIAKTGRNTKQEYDFVKSSDVASKIGDALHAVGVAVIPQYKVIGNVIQYVSRAGTAQFMTTIEATFVFMKAEDRANMTINTPQAPDQVVVTTIGQGSDTGDKGVYKAMTGAHKYGLLHALLIATGDDPETATQDDAMPVNATPTTLVGGDPEAKVSNDQLKLLFGAAGRAGLEKDQFRALVFAVTKKHATNQLVSREVDDILKALEDPDRLRQAQSEAPDAEKVAALVGGTVEEQIEKSAEKIATPAGF